MLTAVLILALAPPPEVEAPSACAIASTPDSNLKALSLPAAIEQRLLAYREQWRSFCARSATRPLLERLLKEAIELSELTVSGAFPAEATEKLLALKTRDLPALGPGLDVVLWVHEGEFAEAATLGTDADRAFWTLYPKVGALQEAPPWIGKTWDYGGCLRFGEYEWIDALDTHLQLRAKVVGETYRPLAQRAEDDLWSELEGRRSQEQLCTCGPTSAVVTDLEAVLRFVRRTPALQGHAPRLEARIRAIRKGSIVLQSEKDGHCSGG
jgi:hypothetical protein